MRWRPSCAPDYRIQSVSPDRLEKLTRLLVAAGPLAAAAGPLQTLANWLGTFGSAVLRLLPGLG